MDLNFTLLKTMMEKSSWELLAYRESVLGGNRYNSPVKPLQSVMSN